MLTGVVGTSQICWQAAGEIIFLFLDAVKPDKNAGFGRSRGTASR